MSTINTVQVREPFEKLIKEYADNFFSKPVLCTMNENIESLRTEKYSMEKDVFQSGEYRGRKWKRIMPKRIRKRMKRKTARPKTGSWRSRVIPCSRARPWRCAHLVKLKAR